MSPDISFVFELLIVCPVIAWLLIDFASITKACKTNTVQATTLLAELRQESATLQRLSNEFFASAKSFSPEDADKRVIEKLNLPSQIGEFASTKAKAQSLVFIGLIGTVTGISISTFLLASGVSSADRAPEKIVDEMSKMLTTLPVAFVVTFVAVFLSVIANRRTHAVISLQNSVEELCAQNNNVRHHLAQARSQNVTHRLLIQMSKLIDPTRDLSNLSNSIDIVKQTAILVSNQQTTLINAMNQLAEPVTRASEELTNFGTAMDASVDKLVPAADKVAATMSSVRETTGVIDKAYEKLFGVSDRLENVAAYLVSDAFRASSQVIGEMTVSQSKFLSTMDVTFATQLQLIQQSIAQQQALQGNFMQLIAAYEAMQRDQIPVVADLKVAVRAQSEVSSSLSDQARTLTESTQKLTTSIDQGNTALNGAMSKTNTTMETMTVVLRTMLDRFEKIPFWPNFPGGKSGRGRN